jgi:chemotaxis protein methyltransferase CheR
MNENLSDITLSNDAINNMVCDIYKIYGYDFSNYSKPSFIRRVNNIINKEKLSDIEVLHKKIIDDAEFFELFLKEITVTVTEMFRDPSFFIAIRTEILPQLKQYSSIRIWHAGCSTGEEVFSMAILLQEAGLLHKSQLYATDINQHVLDLAKRGTISATNFELYSSNYLKSGGKGKLLDYVTLNEQKAIVSKKIMAKISFSTHNLVTDQSLNEFHLIICRNVLIYFNTTLQHKVINLFNDSLPKSGFLALGSKETITCSENEAKFDKINEKEKIWQKR